VYKGNADYSEELKQQKSKITYAAYRHNI